MARRATAGRARAACFAGAASLALAAIADPAWSQSHTQLEKVTKPQIAAIVASKAKRTPAQEKVSSQLLDTVKQAKTGRVSPAAPQLKVKGVASVDEPVKVVIRTNTETASPELLAEIARLHGTDVDASRNFPTVTASVPVSAVETLAAWPEVKTVRRLQAPTRHAAWATEGRKAHAADPDSLRDFNVTGAGVVVCVLSDSLDNLGGAKNQAYDLGALGPAEVHVLKRPDRPGTQEDGVGTESESGEGLAMLEIVHALAPDAELWFATGNGGAAHLADNILELRKAAHCDIMVDDLTYPTESPFQDDDISVAVDRVSREGVLYFSSARNSGNKKHGTSGTWEGMFHDGGPADPKYGLAPGTRVHVFQDGKTVNTADTVLGEGGRVDLFWSDPLGAATNGYDLFVIRASGHVTRASTSSATGTQDPYQSVDELDQGDSIMIVKEAGAAPRFLHLEAANTVLRFSTGGSVRGHSASGAENAFTVAARGVARPVTLFTGGPDAHVEPFSADGPRRVFFKPDGEPYTPGDFSEKGGMVRAKPDITAADGVTTTLPVDTPLNPFSGTSAAAPHAAGIAALMLSCKPERPTPAQVRAAFRRSAIAIEGDSGNVNAGYGIVMAQAALKAACPRAAPSPEPEAPPAGPVASGKE
jgi:subtilisin family serine protease